MAAERRLGVELPDEGLVRVTFDDNIITDTTAEKRQDMDEVAADPRGAADGGGGGIDAVTFSSRALILNGI